MEVPRVLPILRLPNLVVKEVLSIMDPLDLISISKTSLKFKNIAIGCSKQHPISQYRIELVIAYGPMIEVKGTEKSYYYSTDSEYERPEKDSIDEFKDYAEYVKEVFGWPVTDIHYTLDDFPAQYKSIIDWLKFHVKSPENCNLLSEGLAEEPLTYYLDNMETTKDLTIGVLVKDDYRLNLRQSIPRLEITNSSFLTFDQLISIDARMIILEFFHTMSDQELNQFFKNWMTSESNVNLRTFEFYIRNQEALDTILDDLPHELIEPGTVRTIEREDITFHVEEGFDIKRNDGAVAIHRNHY